MDLNQKTMTAQIFRELNPIGTEVAYHGRDVKILSYTLDDYAIVLDYATDEEEAIPIKELIEQNYDL